MPTTYPAFIFGSLPLIAGGPDPSKSSSSFQRYQSLLYCQHSPSLTAVDHNNLPSTLEYFVREGQQFPVENALAYCSGSFQVTTEKENPTVKIKAGHLQCYPGDVDADNYIEHCLPPMPLQVALTGLVGRTYSPPNPTNTDCRTIEVNACVWDAEQKSVSFTVTAILPTSPRWQNFQLPRRGALVTVMGDIVGRKVDGDQIVVLVNDFSYISVRGSEKSTIESMTQDLSSPQTPRNSTRWKGWQSTPQTASGKRSRATIADDDGWLEGSSPSRLRRVESKDFEVVESVTTPFPSS